MGIIGIIALAIVATIVYFFMWLSRRPSSPPTVIVAPAVRRSPSNVLDPDGLRDRIAMRVAEIDKQLNRIARGEMPPREDEAADSEGGSDRTSDSANDEALDPRKDHRLLKPVALLVDAVRAEKASILRRIDREWEVFASLERKATDPHASMSSACQTELGLIEELRVELAGLAIKMDWHAWTDLLSRYRREVLNNREAIEKEIADLQAWLTKEAGLDPHELEHAQKAFEAQLVQFDLLTAHMGDWPQGAIFAGRAIGNVGQVAERAKDQARLRRLIAADLVLFDSELADLEGSLKRVVENGYRPSAGSAEAVIRPFAAKYRIWRRQYEERVDLFGNEREELQKLSRELASLSRHVEAWHFLSSREERRTMLVNASWKLRAACRALENGWAKEGPLNASRSDLLERAERLQAEVRTFHETRLSRFCAGAPPSTEEGLMPVFDRYSELMDQLDEMRTLTAEPVSKLRSQTGVHGIPAAVRR